MFRKICILMLVIAIAITSWACSSAKQPSKEETAEEPAEVLTGGWELVDQDAAVLPDDVLTAFDKAKEQFTGSELKPVAYVASQVVAGMNYMILCEAETVTADPQKSYQMAVIYADLDGNAQITGIKDFDLTAYTEGDGAEPASGEIVGGWTVPEQKSAAQIPDGAKAAFDKAAAELDGNQLEPLALLGTQVVAGTNYAFLCSSTLTTQEPVTSIQVVTVYEDLEGNAKISNICTLDPAEFNE